MATDIKGCLNAFDQNRHELQIFCNGVRQYFEDHPALTAPPAAIHSVKARLKDRAHLAEKIRRKSPERPITPSNLFDRITDLAGVRVLHLYQEQFTLIHAEILQKVDAGDWYLLEKPIAFTWDPESQRYYAKQGLRTELRPTFYTSIHYVVMPRRRSPIKCEIQVRTLFEEIWGEIDHTINYPSATKSVACGEQLRVLSKLVVAGTRLADAIFRSHREYVQPAVVARRRRPRRAA